MTTAWTVTFDCARPGELARFWALALGYADRPVPPGFASWEEWLTSHGVPEDEWDDGAYLSDPTGKLPNISFLRVPESKRAKNRLHIDVQAGGGRDVVPHAERWERVRETTRRLVEAGATVLAEVDTDHIVLTDPEGNEFCVV